MSLGFWCIAGVVIQVLLSVIRRGLDVGVNKLSGTLPAAIGGITSLQSLALESVITDA